MDVRNLPALFAAVPLTAGTLCLVHWSFHDNAHHAIEGLLLLAWAASLVIAAPPHFEE